jgi:hypothetical protein
MEELSHFFESMGYFPVESRNHGNLYLNPIKNTTSKAMGSCPLFLERVLLSLGKQGSVSRGCPVERMGSLAYGMVSWKDFL